MLCNYIPLLFHSVKNVRVTTCPQECFGVVGLVYLIRLVGEGPVLLTSIWFAEQLLSLPPRSHNNGLLLSLESSSKDQKSSAYPPEKRRTNKGGTF